MQIDNRISTGHLMTALAMILAGAAAYHNVKGTAESNRTAVLAMQAEMQRLDTRVRGVELAQASYNSEIRLVHSEMVRLNTQFEKYLNNVKDANR